MAAELVIGAAQVRGVCLELGRSLLLAPEQLGRVEILEILQAFETHSGAALSPVLSTGLTEGPLAGRVNQRRHAQSTSGSISGGSAYASTSTPGMFVLQ